MARWTLAAVSQSPMTNILSATPANSIASSAKGRVPMDSSITAGDLMLFSFQSFIIHTVRINGGHGHTALEVEIRLITPIIVYHILIVRMWRIGDQLQHFQCGDFFPSSHR